MTTTYLLRYGNHPIRLTAAPVIPTAAPALDALRTTWLVSATDVLSALDYAHPRQELSRLDKLHGWVINSARLTKLTSPSKATLSRVITIPQLVMLLDATCLLKSSRASAASAFRETFLPRLVSVGNDAYIKHHVYSNTSVPAVQNDSSTRTLSVMPDYKGYHSTYDIIINIRYDSDRYLFNTADITTAFRFQSQDFLDDIDIVMIPFDGSPAERKAITIIAFHKLLRKLSVTTHSVARKIIATALLHAVVEVSKGTDYARLLSATATAATL